MATPADTAPTHAPELPLAPKSARPFPLPADIQRTLGELIDPARILIRPIDRVAFSSDASFYRLVPRAVIQPRTAEEIKRLFQFSHQNDIPLVFRAGGTSLSGQSITDGILVDIGRYWRAARVEQTGHAIRLQPGVLGQHANDALKLYRRKIGPDPASISSCRMGGILANNASGMCCGVVQNAYHTLQSLTFILPSGTQIDSADRNADNLFRLLEPHLCSTLLRLKSEIEASPALASRIRQKYRTKNTTGYSLNAFLDYDRPVDIFSHLLVGSEGTLAFIAEAILNTVPDYPHKSTALLLFPDLYAAASAIEALKNSGAAALELMDRASLRSVQDHPGLPASLQLLPDSGAAILAEFQAESEARLLELESLGGDVLASLPLFQPAAFTRDPHEQAVYWKVRKGLFPSVGAVRASGTTAVTEDLAFPVPRLADAVSDLRAVFVKHGYTDAIIFGHAKDGNIHFVLSQGFNTPAEVDQYRRLMDDIVTLVTDKYDGALKAEHGTGRNMAPFVETEWGPEAYAIMQQLKAAVDPHHLLNPGVILNANPLAHVTDLKQLPTVEPEVDKCIECGFCEQSCPSRDLTLTPRQRIVVRREMQRIKTSAPSSADAVNAEMFQALDRDFPYSVLDTCAVDGLCATNCPVGINTGELTKRFRAIRHSAVANAVADTVAHHFAATEVLTRMALAVGHAVERTFGRHSMTLLTQAAGKVSRKLLDEPFWQWTWPMPRPRRGSLPARTPAEPQAVYFPACISRMMGALPGEPDDTTPMQALLNIADRAGIALLVPRDATGHCCGVPFSSKGFTAAHETAVNRTIDSLYRWSDSGRLPLVIETSPCTYGLRTCRAHLTPANQEKFDKLRILDAIEFARTSILPHLPITHKLTSVALHPVCSATKLGIVPQLVDLAEACCDEVIVPHDAGCCAFAGDRGFLHPELTASATHDEATELESQRHDGYYSSSRTCEVGMTRATGKLYRSYLHLLDQASRPS